MPSGECHSFCLPHACSAVLRTKDSIQGLKICPNSVPFTPKGRGCESENPRHYFPPPSERTPIALCHLFRQPTLCRPTRHCLLPFLPRCLSPLSLPFFPLFFVPFGGMPRRTHTFLTSHKKRSSYNTLIIKRH